MNRCDQIGNTPLLELTELAGNPLLATVLIKDESTNPTGTHKDRKSAFLIQKAIAKSIDTLAILTSGNAGYSLATLAQDTGIEVVTIVSNDIRPRIKSSLESAGARVVEADFSQPLESNDICNLARTRQNKNIWDVTNEGCEAYAELYEEFAKENAKMIICPIGSGELYMGICKSVDDQKSDTIVMGVHPFHLNQNSKADKLTSGHLPTMTEILSTQLSSSYNGIVGHARHSVTEDDIQWCIDHAPGFLKAEPSALVPLDPIRKYLGDIDQKIIMVSTGKGKVEG